MMSFSMLITSAFNSILNIVLVGSSSKMFRVYANFVITRMKYMFSFWNWAIYKCIDIPRGFIGKIVRIATPLYTSFPSPTSFIASFLNKAPKPDLVILNKPFSPVNLATKLEFSLISSVMSFYDTRALETFY